MSEIDGHADSVHPLNDFPAVLADSAVKWLEGSIRDTSSEVITQLRDALPESVAVIYIVDILKLIAALKPEENAQLALPLGRCKISGVVDTHEPLGILRDEAIPFGE